MAKNRPSSVVIVPDAPRVPRVNTAPQLSSGPMWRTVEGRAKRYAQELARAAQPIFRAILERRKVPLITIDFGPDGYPSDARAVLLITDPEADS